MTVLILAAEFDVSADQMVLALRQREVPVCRVDTAWFPADSVSTRSFEMVDGAGGCVHRDGMSRVQLSAAARCALTVPDTLITNEPSAVRRFAERGATVTKMLGANHIAEEGTRKITFTRPLGDDLADLRGIEVTCHLAQRWAPKQYDCRVIAIGKQLFAFAIHAGNAASYIDFRADYDALTYEPIELHIDVENRIRRFLDTTRLVYGALDFVVDPDGSYVFLECNSGGQFGWLEARTGAPLTETLADLLTQGTYP